ncbi:MAG: hypothetical protein JWM11_6447 [Planctomycetaceae bacterium]|nr:hypothetical protein [Planctomycetaceae bacterium]
MLSAPAAEPAGVSKGGTMMFNRSRFVIAAIGTVLILGAPSFTFAHGFGGGHFGGGHFGGGHFGGGHFGGGHYSGGHYGGWQSGGGNYNGGTFRSNTGSIGRIGGTSTRGAVPGNLGRTGGLSQGGVGAARQSTPSFLSHHGHLAGQTGGRAIRTGNSQASHSLTGMTHQGLGQHGGLAASNHSFSSRHAIHLASHSLTAHPGGSTSFANLRTAGANLGHRLGWNGQQHGWGSGLHHRYHFPYIGLGYGWQGLFGSLFYGFGGYGYGYGSYGYGYGGYPYYGFGYSNSCYPVYGCAYAYDPYSGNFAQSQAYNSIYATQTGFDPAFGTNVNAAEVATNDAVAGLATVADPSTATASFADQGEAAFKAGDFKGAVYAWRHAVLDDPKNPVLVMMFGQALFATGKYDEAAGATQTAMQQLPKENWGVVVTNYKELYGNNQSYTDQLRALEKAVSEKPKEPGLRFLLGFHYGYLGYPQQAVIQLDKVLETASSDEMARQLRAEMQSKLVKSAVKPAK